MSYLKSLETADAKVLEIDFAALRVEAAAPVPAASKPKDTGDKLPPKGEIPIQIAIGAKKDEDFSTWYTDVSLFWNYVRLVPTRSRC